MSKKNKNHGQTAPAAANSPSLSAGPSGGQSSPPKADQPGCSAGNPPVPAAPVPAAAPDVSKKYFFLFWGIIVLTAAAAWILAIILPGVSESVIERWLMAALAASLAVFLLVYK